MTPISQQPCQLVLQNFPGLGCLNVEEPAAARKPATRGKSDLHREAPLAPSRRYIAHSHPAALIPLFLQQGQKVRVRAEPGKRFAIAALEFSREVQRPVGTGRTIE